jgi:hypothetical protein
MNRRAYVFVVIVILTGCGGLSDPLPTGFVNRTQHADSGLWTIWRAAQYRAARQVDLNPLQRSIEHVPPNILPGDRRALQAMPHQLRVEPKPDVPSRVLLVDTGIDRADPTGMIPCPQPCNVHYTAAYSRYQHPLVHYAASWEFQDDNFSSILEYEFESQILYALGYDVKWR